MGLNPVPLNNGETPASYTSRLASANGLCAREFCLDYNVRFQSVVDGNAGAIAKIARLGGADPVALMAQAFVLGDGRFYQHRGERLARFTMRRSRVSVCPRCLADDIRANSKLAPELAVYHRATWMIETIKTCPVHRLGLVEIAHDLAPGTIHDFIHYAKPALSRLDALTAQAPKRSPSAFETYVLRRLDGVRQAPFLDGLELHAAIRTAETIGAVEVFGRRVSRRRMGSNEWWQAGARGFEIAAGGPKAIGEFLTGLQRSYPYRRTGALGPQAFFGRLYQLLAFECQDPAYDAVRAVIADHVLANQPVGPGDVIFGVPVTARTLHSVWTLSVESGIHPKRLRKTLRAAGIVTDSQMALPDYRVLFDAGRASSVIRRAKGALPLSAAGAYINAPRVQITLLAKNRFIESHVPARAFLMSDRYAVEDLDGFLGRLLKGAQTVRTVRPFMANIPSAGKRSLCTGAEVIGMILDGRLSWKGRDAKTRGYLSVLVDVNEVRSKLCRPALGGLTKEKVGVALRTNGYVVDALILHRHLKAFATVHPVSKQRLTVVKPAELAKFQRKYVSLFTLAQEQGKHFTVVQKALNEKGIEPAFKPVKEIGARFYARSELDGVLD